MKKELSPICRRAFFQKVGSASLAILPVAGALGVAAMGTVGDKQSSMQCGYPDGGGVCGYCNGCGRNYDHCDGMYCDYINYSDGC